MVEQTLVPIEQIVATILFIRGKKVILDADLARLYGTTTTRLNQAVKRNQDRFPDDFMFQLSPDEVGNLISQIVTSSGGHGGRRKLPHAFTEHGVVMAASVLNSPKAVEVSVYVVRAFVRQREMLSAHAELATKLERLERRLLERFVYHEDRLDDHETKIDTLIEMINELMTPPDQPHREIGFRTNDE